MAGEIEFLTDDPDDGPVEPRPPKGSWALRIVIGSVAVVALVAWIATRPSGSVKPVAVASSGPVSSPSPVPSAVTYSALPDEATQGTEFQIQLNPGNCQPGISAKSAVAVAIKRYLPALVLDPSNSVQCHQGYGRKVVSESVIGSYRGLEISVNLNAPGTTPISPQEYTGSDRMPLFVSLNAASARVAVKITATGESASAPPVTALRALADHLSKTIVL